MHFFRFAHRKGEWYNNLQRNEGERCMQITRIFHSGFLVETAKRYFIFDYYKGELPKLNPDKPVYVFASHGHQDHYEPKVFELLK